MRRAAIEERSGLLSKVYDDPKYNAAFDRCVDVMARLLQKYGPQLLGQMQEMNISCYEGHRYAFEIHQYT